MNDFLNYLLYLNWAINENWFYLHFSTNFSRFIELSLQLVILLMQVFQLFRASRVDLIKIAKSIIVSLLVLLLFLLEFLNYSKQLFVISSLFV